MSTMRQGRSHAPKLPSALLGTPTATAVSTPPVGVHRCRQAAADGMSECHADHRTKAGGGLHTLVGPGVAFCWTRVKFLETSSSPRPSNFREVSRKAVLFSLPRPKKSVFEYVILAGSSLFTLLGAQSRYGSGLVASWWRTMRSFSMILNFSTSDRNFLLARRGISRF